jgi:predicted aminopeptidase
MSRVKRQYGGILWAGWLAAALFCSGCGIDYSYVLPVVIGQATILLDSVPVGEAIGSGQLSDEQVAKLMLIRDVRDFAGREMGLNTANNYTLFYNAGKPGLAYNVSASLRYEFHARLWELPVVGPLPYLGFFDHVAALEKFHELDAEGYDVFLYDVDAYSTLDWLPNPILSPMLERADLNLIDTVIHELLHSTVWNEGNTTFNESLATFVGQTGAQDYLAARYPDEPDRVQAAVERYADTEVYNAFVFELYGELDAFFTSGLSEEERIAGREAYYQAGRERFAVEYEPLLNHPENYAWVADFPANNAFMLANYRYNLDLNVFAQVHEATGRVWRDTLAVFRSAASANDPNAYLRDWVAEYVQGSVTLSEPDTSAATRPVRRGLCPRGTCLARPLAVDSPLPQ